MILKVPSPLRARFRGTEYSTHFLGLLLGLLLFDRSSVKDLLVLT